MNYFYELLQGLEGTLYKGDSFYINPCPNLQEMTKAYGSPIDSAKSGNSYYKIFDIKFLLP